MKPTITIDCPVTNILKKGQTFTCNCKGTNGNPDAVVTWYKENEEVENGEKLSKELVLTNVDKQSSGTYRCEAKSYDIALNETKIIVGWYDFIATQIESHYTYNVGYFINFVGCSITKFDSN